MTCGAVTPTHGQRPTHEWQRTDVVPLGARSESKARVTMHRSLKTGTSMQSPTDQRRPTHAVQGPHVGRLPPQVVRRSSASATGAAMAVSLPKATQSIPPAVRRHVFHRDRGRCVVPGCTFGGFLDAHHLCPRAEGGTHDTKNLVMLCGNHHIDLHLGRISIEGNPSTKLEFLRADGSKYTEPPSARTVAASEQVFGALRNLGFSERVETRCRACARKVRDALPEGAAAHRARVADHTIRLKSACRPRTADQTPNSGRSGRATKALTRTDGPARRTAARRRGQATGRRATTNPTLNGDRARRTVWEGTPSRFPL